MRSSTGGGILREALRDTHRALASVLLAGAMLAPIVEAVAGWAVHTPLGVPLLAHVALLTVVGVAATGAASRPRVPHVANPVGWLVVPPVAVSIAAILDARANAYYTEHALIEGMTALFTLHLGVTVLRRRALRRLDQADAHRSVPFWRRHGAEWRHVPRVRSLLVTPGVRVADSLTVLLGWMLLLAWTLIALAHRHPAGPLLLLAGAIEVLALIVLLPDALAEPRPRVDRSPYGARDAVGASAPTAERREAPRAPMRTFPMLPRSS